MIRNQGWYHRRGRRAVGSHSRRGMHNPCAMSSYIPCEIVMNTSDRKNSLLPCGFTIEESWAALRKSWLGFEIAHSNGDSGRMSRYAYQITKLQRQLGIEVTKFHEGLLDEQTLEEIDEELSGYTTEVDLGDSIEERSLDYDGMMDEAHKRIGCQYQVAPAPPERSFAKSTEVSKSVKTCEYKIPPEKQKPPEIVQKNSDQNSRTCSYVVPYKKQELPEIEKYKGHYESPDSCWYEVDPSTSRVRKNRPKDYSEDSISRHSHKKQNKKRKACH
jgi:hypothetical protein